MGLAIREGLMRQTVMNREKQRSRIVESFYTLLFLGGVGGMILLYYLFLSVEHYVEV